MSHFLKHIVLIAIIGLWSAEAIASKTLDDEDVFDNTVFRVVIRTFGAVGGGLMGKIFIDNVRNVFYKHPPKLSCKYQILETGVFAVLGWKSMDILLSEMNGYKNKEKK